MDDMTWEKALAEMRDHVRGRHFGPIRFSDVTIPYGDVERIVNDYEMDECVRDQISLDGRTISVDLSYPQIEPNPDAVRVGLEAVRAADDITIRYDFERDGYAITRERSRWADGRIVRTGEIAEVAFIPAWTWQNESASPPSPPRRTA